MPLTRLPLARNLLLALACAAGGWLGLRAPYLGEAVTLVWPPTGIAFAALWLGGLRLVPGSRWARWRSTWRRRDRSGSPCPRPWAAPCRPWHPSGCCGA
ncbi:hypothetical protein HHL28_14110 [Aerophototrophica crusticola]|uniref:Uncharacterized protein n=1 Tax=Aerophototrophica crusticola TaxID=1709002 RepID=A0A858R9J0_9PROT|nr:hypothetical protein HHL28_14110 [Rhodospirillaceae bacterium B3]